MPENGVELARFTATPWPAHPGKDNPLRVLFTGRLVPFKGLDMLLRAVARLHGLGRAILLDVVGDGPMRDEWQALADELDLQDCVRFHGALSIDEVALQMQACHVFCLPSVRESGGAVLLEAMASARPVIALNFGGPGEIVNAEAGALLPLESPEQVTKDLATTLAHVLANPEAWRQRGLAARQQVERQYSWSAKVAAVQDVYRDVLAEKGLSCC
jgi:glycosyltransferase involved in cell wall biosynthesis